MQETFFVSAAQLQAPPAVCGRDGEAIIDAILPMDGRMISRLVVERLVPQGQPLAA